MTLVTPPLLLRISEVEQLLGISRESVYALIDQGELIRVKIGTSVRIPRHLVDAYVERLIADATPAPQTMTVQSIADHYVAARRQHPKAS